MGPYNDYILAGTSEKQVVAYSMTSLKQLANFTGHGNDVTGVTFTCEKNIIASCSTDRNLKFWDLSKSKNTKSIYCVSGVKCMD